VDVACTTLIHPYAAAMNHMQRDGFLLLAYCGLIFFLSAQSTLIDTPLDFANKDKLIHAIAYAMMGYAAWKAFRHHLANPILLALVSLLFASVYGVSDEFHQSFVAGRNADVWDWLADTVGATCMVGILYHDRIRKV